VLVDTVGRVVHSPQRVPLDAKKIQERWLQDLIRRHPEILPVGDIEPAFSPLVAVGMEVNTAVGPIDNLYISPSGYITLAETKLWRNPEARREVVGQIVDYAKELREWSFEDLDKRVRTYNKAYRDGDLGIIETLRMSEQIDEADEASLVDTISRNLERGRLLLLVVGDGIRESVEAMATFLGASPQLHFTLALVELELYEIATDSTSQLLVIPHVVTKTREVVRAVVRLEGTTHQSVRIGLDTQPESGRADGKRNTLTEDDYYSQLASNVDPTDVEFAKQLAADMQNRGFIIDWKANSYVVKLPDPGQSGKLLTILVVPTDGKTYIGWLGEQLRHLGLDDSIAIRFARDSASLFPGVKQSDKEPTNWSKSISLRDLRNNYSAFSTVVDRTTDEIKQASGRDEE
jgi:hypothetical protein